MFAFPQVPFPQVGPGYRRRRGTFIRHILATWPVAATGPTALYEPALSTGITSVAVPATLT